MSDTTTPEEHNDTPTAPVEGADASLANDVTMVTPVPAPSSPLVQIEVDLLRFVHKIIDLANRRGIFELADLQNVGIAATAIGNIIQGFENK